MHNFIKMFTISFLSVALPMYPVAAQGLPATAAGDTESSARLVFQAADGEMVSQELGRLGAAVKTLPGMTIDGVEGPDALSVFEAGIIEGTLAGDGAPLVIERRGRTLQRIFPEHRDGRNALTVHWNEALDTLFIDSGDERHVLQIEGVNDPFARGRHLARLAILALGADIQSLGVSEKVAWGVVIIVVASLATLGYLACVTAGNAICLEAATETECPSGTALEVKQICGSGFDFDGELRLGWECLIRCVGTSGGGGPIGGPNSPSPISGGN